MLPLHQQIVYGPVRSRRLGTSLGINVLPRGRKVCTFNCTYCQYGWTRTTGREASCQADAWPAPAAVARAVAVALEHLQAQREAVDRLTLAGNGEPTLHPRFAEIVDAVRAVRDGVAPGVPVAVLSNSSTLESASVRAGLDRVDERHMKLDAGDPVILRRLNAATVPLAALVRQLRDLGAITIQSMFVRDRLGRIDNATDAAVASWIAAVREIRPRAVHVYTLDRPPAWPYLQAVPAVRLNEIAHQARAAGLEVRAFVASAPVALSESPALLRRAR